MVESRNHTIQELFLEAMACDPAQREAFLKRIGADDPGLRREVESLIAAHDDDPRFLESSPWNRLASERPPAVGDAVPPPQPAARDLPFERLGAFRLIDRLGAGGMGEVYMAVQEPIGRQVALKVIRRERMRSFEAVQRFLREVDALSRIRHPNIVTVFASGEQREVLYFAMDLVPGLSLEELLVEKAAQEARIPLPGILSWLRDIARALESAHREGIIHRDVKPANIRITPNGLPMLVDFGIARQADLSTLTLTGTFQGTPHFASPEQVEAESGTIDARTDVYSLGVTLYQAVTGALPFTGDTTEQVFHKILSQEPLPPRRHDPTLSRDVETVILKAMAKNPADRYGTMDALADDLDCILNDETIAARPVGFTTRCLRRIRRYPVVSTAVGVALAALLALAICVPWVYALSEGEKRRAAEEFGAAVEKQRKLVLEAQKRAENEADRANTIKDFMVGLFSAADPLVRGENVKVIDVLASMEKKIERELGDQPETAIALHDVNAGIHRDLGHFNEALRCVERGIELCNTEIDNNHHSELMLRNTKATILEGQGHHSDAEAIYRAVLQQRRELYGDDHLDTIASINNLANCLSTEEHHDEAELLLCEARNRLEALGKRDHPLWHTVLNSLAVTRLYKKEYGEAEELLRDVLAVRQREKGDDHPYTLTTKNNLADALRGLGRLEEAEDLLRHCLEGQLRAFPEGHDAVLKTKYNLARVLLERKAYAEAEPFCAQAYEGFKHLEGNHPHKTLQAMEVLAYLLLRQSKYAACEELLLERLEIVRALEAPGAGRDRTLGALHALQQLHTAWGRPQKAAEYATSIQNIKNAPDGE